MKKINIILMTFALVMTMSQCKKNEEQPVSGDEMVTITLNVDNNDGSRVIVNTVTGTVDFESGDKIYVGSGGKYVGFLTHNGTNFSGNITNPTENQPLQFYFLGNVTPTETLSAGTTEECSVIITDQTEHLPVISCAASNENYVSGVTAYSAHLLNKCALVKFNVTTPSNSPICITGMKNKVMVDFANNTMTPSQDGEGVIMLPAGSGENVEKWAILLPQDALEEGEEGSAYSEDGVYEGTRPEIPVITENGYLIEGILLMVEVNPIPVGAIKGLFTINYNGDQVYFSRGNLQYQASTNTWRFGEKQWDYVGDETLGTVYENNLKSDNSLFSSTYNGWIDLFIWGPGDNPITIPQGHNITFIDWGSNPIINGGNTNGIWRTLSGGNGGEWDYVFNTRSTTSDIRFAKAQVNNINGVILLPDDWNNDIYSLNNTNMHNSSFSSNIISSSQWIVLENAGAVFFPAAGYHYDYSVRDVGSRGYYWSSTGRYNSYEGYSMYYFVNFGGGSSGLNTTDYNGYYFGRSVRLVQDYN